MTSVSGGEVGAAHVEEGVVGVGVGEEGLGEIRGLRAELSRQLAVVGTSGAPGTWRRKLLLRLRGCGGALGFAGG